MINKGIVVGTGNKVEDFGVGFYTKYGDGGVDISPIADCNKTDQFGKLEKNRELHKKILSMPYGSNRWSYGLDGRTDEGQLGGGFDYQSFRRCF